ncbi:GntR family transcriptional regulator [Sulfidibacter corallicola]|uniref:GntR family transcriptional regulator n=1 Tax=Sulfidibacter corallicola TaxID=2818388 RepID=A0A8A4TLE4_SULCO|nr:GntR family transcriptional regulator [Sulfidibacter corallicola]QTD50024.1 GntR family transcriptional regulator [Sulfidibacter corallicola]
MLPFPVSLRPGAPPYQQITFAVRRAIAKGLLKPGDPFPSVRQLSRELKINPNTAQKAVSELTTRGFLEVHTGRGTFVCRPRTPSHDQIAETLQPQLEQLVVMAHELDLDLSEVKGLLAISWQSFQEEP